MSNSTKKSALSEKEGIKSDKTDRISPVFLNQSFQRKKPSASQLSNRIKKGNKTALSQAITLIESTNPTHLKEANTIIANCLPTSGNSIRIGITGVPGVGKSSFIEQLGLLLIAEGKKVAVLAVDPSSAISKGSILGDKTRMDALTKEDNAFIRPSPSGKTLGGVARKTRETIILCETAGFDVILIETVGVGQSETAVHSMVDFFLLLKLAGAGDQLQGIKRGIMELADGIVINKADGDNIARAEIARVEFKRAIQLFPPKPNGWTPKVLSCSAIENKGITNIWQVMLDFIKLQQNNKAFYTQRQEQNKFWVLQTIEDTLIQQFYNHPKIVANLKEVMLAVTNNKISPFVAASTLLKLQSNAS